MATSIQHQQQHLHLQQQHDKAAAASGALAPTLVLHLFPTHFTFQNQDHTFQYNGPLKPFLRSIQQQVILPEAIDLFPDSLFRDGGIPVEIHDHRVGFRKPGAAGTTTTATTMISFNEQQQQQQNQQHAAYIYRIHLKQDDRTIFEGLRAQLEELGLLTEFSEQELSRCEAKILTALEPTLCLEPTLDVLRVKSQLNYNATKYRVPRKRPRDWAEKEEKEARKEESNRLMMIMEDEHKRNFHPRFGLLTFIEDWRKKRAVADAEPIITLDNKNKRRRMSNSLPNSVLNHGKLVRTLRFISDHKDGKQYMILNFYEMGNGDYEAVLRWGDQEGTAINGTTMRFPIGNVHAVDYYVSNMRQLHKDSFVDDIVASGSNAHAAATAAAAAGGGPKPIAKDPTTNGMPVTPMHSATNTQSAANAPSGSPSVINPGGAMHGYMAAAAAAAAAGVRPGVGPGMQGQQGQAQGQPAYLPYGTSAAAAAAAFVRPPGGSPRNTKLRRGPRGM
ncbi:Spt20 family-domain-containing protein [Cladochytrium replicatum]|nr:Spt20 family-domain-containing protein [Cladochytrium replicatum]